VNMVTNIWAPANSQYGSPSSQMLCNWCSGIHIFHNNNNNNNNNNNDNRWLCCSV
jgi:hypothetical protein